MVTREKCQRWFDLIEMEVTERMICAGNENGNSCKGDSGGPVTTELPDGKVVQVGVVSWGKNQCGAYGYPGVYVNLAHPEIRSFILEQIGL